MRDLAGWEMLLGGAVILWVLWRFGRRGGEKLSREETAKQEPGAEQPGNDWLGLLLPLGVVFLFVLFLINSVRAS